MSDWNDWRFFLSVAREGSTLTASRALRVSQTTVARRIAALEEALGLSLFERRQAGYSLTEDGTALLPHATAIEERALAAEDFARGRQRDLGGTVCITTEDIYATGLLAPLLRDLHERHPGIVIDLDATQQVRDLGKGQADIALRNCTGDQPAGLVGRRICEDDWTLYCSRDYAAQHGAPSTVAELKRHPIVGGGGGNLWRQYQAWLKSLGLEEQVAMHHANSTGLLSAVRSGFGIAVLPCIVADADPTLVRCIAPRSDHGRSVWLLTHERVRHSPRVRTVIDFLYERLSAHVRLLRLDEAKVA